MSEDILEYINLRHVFEIHEGKETQYNCPNCSEEYLFCDQGDLQFEETGESRALRYDDCWDEDWIEYSFNAVLKCKKCFEIVFCVGVGSFSRLSLYGSDEDLAKLAEEDFISRDFIPRYFYPPIKQFEIPSDCSDGVKQDINSAFSLAYCDFSASGNKLRSALEKLTNQLLPGSESNFHQKLDELKSIDLEASEILMSIKWLGNEASHESSLKQYDLTYALNALRYALSRLFDEDPKRIRGFSKMINAKKGSIVKT
ncbi:DUF4145 domain-containing protein [Teredinibacter turnerae]|uniref:DUF4145 domain-containing protein n=1 Tax=Teredinibacter turnerae TaxID=2426 RepID=UPI0003FA939C|nr:DUF4145 domain-containing protein [Teredinibacter turnerae]